MKTVQLFKALLSILFLTSSGYPAFAARYPSIVNEAISADGYTAIINPGGTTYQANHEQLEEAQENIAKYVVDEVLQTPANVRRKDLNSDIAPRPYALLHAEGKAYSGS